MSNVSRLTGVQRLLLAVILMMSLTGSVFADETDMRTMSNLTVCASGCDYTSIHDAVEAAPQYGTIDIKAGTYYEALYIDKDVTLQGENQATTIIDAQAEGSVIEIDGFHVITIADLTLTNGLGSGRGEGSNDGAGIFSEGDLTVLRSTITGNDGEFNGAGAGIWNGGRMLVRDSTISYNISVGTGDEGDQAGGIYNHIDGHMEILNSTISHNTSGRGAGIRNFGSMEMTNTTVSNNYGIGIDNAYSGRAIISNSTINENDRSGVRNGSGVLALSNTIIANSGNDIDCTNGSGTIHDQGFNIIENGNCGFGNSSNSAPDPLLGELADNGGLTFTHLPLEGSLAIDRGNCTSFSVIHDQRNIARPQGKGCDIGSVEVTPSDPTSPSSCGGLIQEAEDGVLSGYFEIGHDRDASEGKYIYVPNRMGNRWNGPDSAHKADYCFTVETDGVYQIKGWIYATSGMDNSFFVRTLNSSTNGFLWDFPKNSEYRSDYVSNRNGEDPVQVVLSAGKYPVEILLREDGARLDKLELVLIEETNPKPTICNDLVAEAEEGKRTGGFALGDDSTASGGQYVYVPNGGGNSFDMPDPYQQIEYCFTVETTGTYRIKGGIYATSGRDNSFFVKVDNAPSNGYLWDFPKNTTYRKDYVSHRNGDDPVEVKLDAGQHAVTIFLREDGARLDTLELELVDNASTQQILTSDPAPIARGVKGTLMVKDSQNQEEIDLSGINLTLIDTKTGGSDYSETTQTDHLGQYYFDEMEVGQYKLSLQLPDSYRSTQPTEVDVTTNTEQMVDVSFDVQFIGESTVKIFLPLVIK